MINETNNQDTVKTSSFLEIFSLRQGINNFGQKVHEVTFGIIPQIHQITLFKPIKVADLNTRYIKRALESLIFLAENYRRIKK